MYCFYLIVIEYFFKFRIIWFNRLIIANEKIPLNKTHHSRATIAVVSNRAVFNYFSFNCFRLFFVTVAIDDWNAVKRSL